MNDQTLNLCLLFSSALFCIGLITTLSRSSTILILLGIELMLNSANINFIVFERMQPDVSTNHGTLFVLFTIAIAASEAAVGLALLIALFKHQRSVVIDEASQLKG